MGCMDPDLAKQEANRELERLKQREKELLSEMEPSVELLRSTVNEIWVLLHSTSLEGKFDELLAKFKKADEIKSNTTLLSNQADHLIKSREELKKCLCCRGIGNHLTDAKTARSNGWLTRECDTCRGTGELDP
jgi:HSP90 family molecular chaperone